LPSMDRAHGARAALRPSSMDLRRSGVLSNAARAGARDSAPGGTLRLSGGCCAHTLEYAAHDAIAARLIELEHIRSLVFHTPGDIGTQSLLCTEQPRTDGRLVEAQASRGFHSAELLD